jgi:hypothetical protein
MRKLLKAGIHASAAFHDYKLPHHKAAIRRRQARRRGFYDRIQHHKTSILKCYGKVSLIRLAANGG